MSLQGVQGYGLRGEKLPDKLQPVSKFLTKVNCTQNNDGKNFRLGLQYNKKYLRIILGREVLKIIFKKLLYLSSASRNLQTLVLRGTMSEMSSPSSSRLMPQALAPSNPKATISTATFIGVPATIFP